LAAALLVCFASSASAVLVYDGSSANLSAPGDDPGWDAVGTIYVGSASSSPATAIFLGNNGGYGWFLTANHVGLAGATLSIGSGNYTAFYGQDQIESVDLKVFRVGAEISGISGVSLASAAPDVGSNVTMIGYGKTGTKVTWDTSGNGTWTSPGLDAEGYTWSDPNVKRWGTNTVYATNVTYASSSNLTVTDFDASPGEAQGSLGDSGGGVFSKNRLNWELAALIVNVGVTNGVAFGGAFSGQPGSTSVAAITGLPNSKSVTFSVQVSNYRDAILAAIPEPSSVALLAGSLALFAGALLRRRVP